MCEINQTGTVTTKPFFREAFKQTRCIIPASGYYEWQDTPGGKQPHYFTRTDGQVISFAALWDEWKDRATGETMKSCTMIITEPNAMVAEVHDRMPVLLEPDQFTPWLENEADLEIFEARGRWRASTMGRVEARERNVVSVTPGVVTTPCPEASAALIMVK
jgi:putative SOS response-associated peptidase YedK